MAAGRGVVVLDPKGGDPLTHRARVLAAAALEMIEQAQAQGEDEDEKPAKGAAKKGARKASHAMANHSHVLVPRRTRESRTSPRNNPRRFGISRTSSRAAARRPSAISTPTATTHTPTAIARATNRPRMTRA